MGLVILAGCSAVTLHARVYEQFDRVRIRVVTSELRSVDGSVVVPLPDVTSLSGMPTAIVLRLQNGSPETESVGVVVSGAELGRVVIRPTRSIRVDLSVPAESSFDEHDRVELTGSGDDWALEYLELANVHGFSSGLFSFVITPDDATLFDPPSGVASLLLFFVLLVLPIPLFRLEGGTVVRFVSLVPGATVLCLLFVTLLLPVVSEYKLLLSAQAFLLCMVILYGAPIVAWLVPRAARLCVSQLAIVARLVTSTFQRLQRPRVFLDT